jgi:hypothetical protein
MNQIEAPPRLGSRSGADGSGEWVRGRRSTAIVDVDPKPAPQPARSNPNLVRGSKASVFDAVRDELGSEQPCLFQEGRGNPTFCQGAPDL